MRMFKRLISVLVFILLLPILPTSANTLTPASKFTFIGSGYGHGVGMSQIGARAKALAGESATTILQYYYSGTQIETVTDTQILRINVGHLLTSARIKSDSPDAQLQLFAGSLGETETAAPLLIIPSKTSLNFLLSNKNISITSTRGSKISAGPIGASFTLRWSGTRYLAGAESVISLSSAKTVNRYRHGQMHFKVIKDKTVGHRLEIINSVRLQDEYLWGVSEVPSLWPTAALEAQAIASRTYAYAKSVKIRSACDCHLYGTISDQTFAGFAKEGDPKFGILWKNAVNNTIGSIITYAGKPITAYFSSSSGGVTETSEHAWGTATPYTLSVADTSSADLILNPRFATWDREITQQVVAAAFLLPDVISLQVLGINPSGTVAFIEATSSLGKKVKLRGETFRSRSKLPSAWFILKN